MKRHGFIFSLVTCILSVLGVHNVASAGEVERPALVVNIVVGGLPYDFIGMYGVAAGMEGFMQTKLNWPQRLFCIACGLMLIDTGVLTDIVGITGIAVMTFLQRRAVRQTA